MLAVWDAGGNDTFSAANQTGPVFLDLHEGHYSTMGPLQFGIGIAFGVTIEAAIGGTSNDVLFGNEVANLLYGGDSNDWLGGFEAADRLFGDQGPDRLWGDDADDLLTGGEADDSLDGGDGRDWLLGDEDIAADGSAGADPV